MSKYRVLVSCPLIQEAMTQYADRLTQHGIRYEIAEVNQQLNEAELQEIIKQYHGIIAGDDELTRNVLRQAERLEVIVKWGIGTDNIDKEAADEFGIKVRNTPDAFGTEVADVVIGYAIMLTRDLHRIDAAVREGRWTCPRGKSLAGKTLGVIGVGDIGAAVARRGDAHGMSVLGNDVQPIPEGLKQQTGIEAVGKNSLIAEADILSLNCALTKATRKMIGADELTALGSDGYLINTARGELVDEDALVEALETGTIAGAGLDVFETEPLPASHPLTEFENVILGSHNAQNTREAVSRVNDRAIDQLVDALTN